MPRERWRELATALEAELTGQSALFPAEPDITVLVEALFKRKEARGQRRPSPPQPEPALSSTPDPVHQDIYRILDITDPLARRQRRRKPQP